MLENIFLLIIGLVVLIFGGELLVRGATRLALKLKISPLVVGLTIVAFGTSAPELFISLKSALAGSPDIAIGNVVGSNICNLTLILGLTAVITPIPVGRNSIRIDWPMAMGGSFLAYLWMMDGIVGTIEGIILVLMLAAYTFFIIRKSRNETNDAINANLEIDIDPEINSANTKRTVIDILLVVAGCVGLYFGSDWFVFGAIELAGFLGVSERVIGLTVVAIGTSLPEMVTSVMASLRKQIDVALGNLIGSNIFNIFSILGITSIVQNIPVSAEILSSDMIWMIAITILILPMMISKKNIQRFEGMILFLVYGIYTYSVLV